MLFAHDGNVEKAFKDSIMNSVKEREAEICDTWDAVKVMALPWGVKEDVEPDKADDVKTYIEGVADTKIALDSGKTATILKVGLKERKGQYKLIYGYQLD